jgi:hypothetical protein
VHRRFTFDRPSPGDAGSVEGESKQMFSPEQLADFAAKLLLRRIRRKVRPME